MPEENRIEVDRHTAHGPSLLHPWATIDGELPEKRGVRVAVSVGLAAVLLVLFLRTLDFAAVGKAIRGATSAGSPPRGPAGSSTRLSSAPGAGGSS